MSGLPFLSSEDRPDCMTAPHLFYSDDKDDQAQARSLCRDCPFRIPCEEYAMGHEAHGQWGYTTPKQREVMRDAWGISLVHPTVKRCGRGLHDMTESNTTNTGDGRSRCRACVQVSKGALA